MSKVINIKGVEEFKKEVIDSTLPVLVDFWAPWCGPCLMMAPILDELSKKHDGKLIIAKVNTEEADNRDLAYTFQIQSIPNMKLFKGGKIIEEFIGFRPGEVFEKELINFLN